MATPGHSMAARTYWNFTRVSPIISGGGFEVGQDMVEIQTLENAYKSYLAGKPGVSGLQLNGFLDIADDGWDELTDTYRANARNYVSWYPTGSTAGSIAYEVSAIATAESRAFDQANIVMLNWEGQPTDLFYRGKTITSGEQAVTATGALTGQNIGVTSATQSEVVCIRCVSVSGSGSAAFRIDGSSDNGAGDAYAQVTGFSAYAAVGNVSVASSVATFTGLGAIWLYKTGVTEAWTRLNCTTFSGFTSVSIQASAGVAAIG